MPPIEGVGLTALLLGDDEVAPLVFLGALSPSDVAPDRAADHGPLLVARTLVGLAGHLSGDR